MAAESQTINSAKMFNKWTNNGMYVKKSIFYEHVLKLIDFHVFELSPCATLQMLKILQMHKIQVYY